MATASSTIEDKKRLVRRLAGSGRGFAEQYGFRVTNNPSSLFQLLCLAVLLARRGDNGRWSVPAGTVDPGEQPADALVREVHEETGVKVAIDRLAGVGGARYD